VENRKGSEICVKASLAGNRAVEGKGVMGKDESLIYGAMPASIEGLTQILVMSSTRKKAKFRGGGGLE